MYVTVNSNKKFHSEIESVNKDTFQVSKIDKNGKITAEIQKKRINLIDGHLQIKKIEKISFLDAAN